MRKNIVIIYLIFILILILFTYLFFFSNNKNNVYESIENYNTKSVEIVVARYNEDLNWLKDVPFSKYNYTVYNKSGNANYYKSEKFKEEIKLPNVGREAHSYFTHIINNYDDKNFSDLTIFLPGSIELENKYERGKKLLNEIDNVDETDLFACILYDKPIKEVFNDFQIDSYHSSNENNKTLNTSTTMKLSGIRPFGKWYESVFNKENKDSKCFTQNSIFGLTKDTILKKPKSYYIDLMNQVDGHSNPETGHFIERSWETIFYPYSNVKYTF